MVYDQISDYNRHSWSNCAEKMIKQTESLTDAGGKNGRKHKNDIDGTNIRKNCAVFCFMFSLFRVA